MKRSLFLSVAVCILALSLVLCSCAKKNDNPTSEPVTAENTSASAYKLVFVQYDNSYQENEMREAFISQLRLLGYDGINLKIDVKNAQCSPQKLAEQVKDLKNSSYDLIVAVSDEAAIEISKAKLKTPCVFIGATDPVGDGLVTSLEKPDKNMTGNVMSCSDAKTVSLIRIFTPDVKKVGILLLKGSTLNEGKSEEFKKYASSEGLSAEIYTAERLNDIEEFTKKMLSEVDAVYVPTDGRLNSVMEKIVAVATSEKKFVFASSTAAVNSGALAAFCSSPTLLGNNAAVIADEILKGAKASEIAVDTSVEGNIFLSAKTYSMLGIGIPQLEGLTVI